MDNPLLSRTKSFSSGAQFIWADDFGNRNTAAAVAYLGATTYAQLAEISEQQLVELNLDQGEIGVIKKILAQCGLELAEV